MTPESLVDNQDRQVVTLPLKTKSHPDHHLKLPPNELIDNSRNTSVLPSPTTTTTTSTRPVRRKLVVVGDGACGKTSLLVAYCDDKFSFDYIPTVFSTTVTSVPVEDKLIELSLWDTAGTENHNLMERFYSIFVFLGQEDYDRLRPLSYGDTHVVLVCFAIDKPESLQSVQRKWIPDLDLYCPGVPRILVGCKLDLRPLEADMAASALNLVSHEQGQIMAEQVDAVSYIECSAKTRANVKSVFAQAARVSLTYQKRKGNAKSKPRLSLSDKLRRRTKCQIV